MRNIDHNSVSLAGEFAVLSQLALRNFDANMTLGHTKGVDILVSDPKTKKMYRLEVKTKYSTTPKESHLSKVFGTVLGEWMMDKKHEGMVDPSLFYCFVIYSEPKSAFQFFIVPSRVVARYVKEEHKHWLRVKGKEGKKVKDTEMRIFRIGFKGEKYRVATPTVQDYKDKWKFRVP